MFYSQNGEDFIIDQIFQGAKDGFFVEVGCIDGRLFSNTLHFEEKGWKGMCIEAHQDYIGLLSRNRPNSRVCHCAVGEKNADAIPFYATERGSLSTLDKEQENRWKKDFSQFFNGFTVQSVPMRTLTSIFLEEGVTEIDLLSIDIEGYEVEALGGLDFERFRPKVIVVESDSPEHEQRIAEMLQPYSYRKVVHLNENLFFIRPDVGCGVEEGSHQIRLLQTGNPLIGITPVFTTLDLELSRNGAGTLKGKTTRKHEPVSSRFQFQDVGFHGDLYLLEIVDKLIAKCEVEVFVETGTNIGSTLAYAAKTYPKMRCYSCEPSEDAFSFSLNNTLDYPNAKVFHMTSQQFITDVLEELNLFERNVLFWLDAHGYGFEWPLLEEVAYITGRFSKGLLLIDDFKVPGKEHFGYDQYQNQECSFEYIEGAISPDRGYQLYYPDYDEHTSKHHPLRGWGLIAWGFDIDGLIRQSDLKMRKFKDKVVS